MRRATRQDLEALNALYATAFSQRVTAADIDENVIVVDENVSSSYSAHLVRHPGKWNAYTAFLVTHPDHRMEGRAAAVTRFLLDELDRLAVSERFLVLATVRPDRVGSRKAHLAAGFVKLASSNGDGWDLLGYWAHGHR